MIHALFAAAAGAIEASAGRRRTPALHLTIPMPHYGKTVTDYALAVASLIHDLGGAHEGNPRALIEGLGFTVQRDENRWGAAAPSVPQIF